MANNLLIQTIENIDTNRINLMTHIVAGYPSFDVNWDVIKTMVEEGVSMIEIQIPHSDPMADGPTIVKANQESLDLGTSVQQVFDFIKKVKNHFDIPILIMSYYNILYKMGVETFCQKSIDAGVVGLIVPDIPYDESRENFYAKISSYGLVGVPVISPHISIQREKEIIDLVRVQRSFLYVTLKVGVTGVDSKNDNIGVAFLKELNTKYPDICVAAGFGLSNRSQIDFLMQHAKVSIFIVGSKLINVTLEEGHLGVRKAINDFIS